MKSIIGIIAEYNPMHSGHVYQLGEAKKLGALACQNSADSGNSSTSQNPAGSGDSNVSLNPLVVIAMSGNFVQRGEPAIYDKWQRAEMAVRQGADLVVELPTYYATSAAPDFARGGVGLLKMIGATHICFGSEIGSIDEIRELSQKISSESVKSEIRSNMKSGLSYAEAARKAGILAPPNAMLAAEYLKYAEDGSNMLEPILVKREPAPHPTALSVREKIAAKRAPKTIQNPYLDSSNKKMVDILSEASNLDYRASCVSQDNPSKHSINSWESPLFLSSLDAVLLYLVRGTPSAELSEFRGMTEGLENRLKKSALNATDATSLIENAATRRYTPARIRRALISALLGIRKDIDSKIDYIRVLAVSSAGREILSEIKKKSEAIIITKLSKYSGSSPLLEIDKRAASLYSSLIGYPDYEHSRLPYGL